MSGPLSRSLDAERLLVGVFFVDVVFEFVAAVLAVAAEGALVLRLAAALERDVAHEVAARVVGALALGALVALLAALAQREVRARVAGREDVVRRLALLVLVRGRARRLGLRRRDRLLLVLLRFLRELVGRRHVLQYRERFRSRLLSIVFITTRHHS